MTKMTNAFKAIAFAAFGLAILVSANPASAASERVELAQGAAGGPRLAIKTVCQKDVTVFQVQNVGENWPAPAIVAVYAPGAGTVVIQRRVRMAANQTVTFRIPGETSGESALNVAVVGPWLATPVHGSDAVRCR